MYSARDAASDSVSDWIAQDGLLAVGRLLWECACEARILAEEVRTSPPKLSESSGFDSNEKYRQAAAIDAWCDQLDDWQFSGENGPPEAAEHDEQQSQEVAEDWAAEVRAEAREVLNDLKVQ